MRIFKTVRLDKYNNSNYYLQAAPGVWHDLEGDLYCVTIYALCTDAPSDSRQGEEARPLLHGTQCSDMPSVMSAATDMTGNEGEDVLEQLEQFADEYDCWLSSHLRISVVDGQIFAEAELLTEDGVQAACVAALAPIQAPGSSGGSCGCA